MSDVDRAKRFYGGLGWRLDADFAGGDDFRVIQFTPPGSPCSVIFGKNVTAAAPGSAQGLYLIVSDIEAASPRAGGRGVEFCNVFHGAMTCMLARTSPICSAGSGSVVRIRKHGSYQSFASFRDPDGNGWLFQEITARLPGRIDAEETTFSSSADIAAALRRAAAAHGEHEKRVGKQEDEWPDWYADYMVREQAGKPLPS